MNIDGRTRVNQMELEALVRNELKEGLDGLINRPLNDEARHQVEAFLRDRLAHLMDQGDVPPSFFLHAVKPSEADEARGMINVYMVRNFAAYPMTEKEFEELFGRYPRLDNLHRVNCADAGTAGHAQCGWCMEHETARFVCGCWAKVVRDGSPTIGITDPGWGPDGRGFRVPEPLSIVHAPRMESDARLVVSAADVDAVHALGEIDTDQAIVLKAAFMHGECRAVRLMRWLPEDHPPPSGLVRECDVLDFIRARFPSVCDQSVEPRMDSMSFFVTVTTRLDVIARENLAERIRDALTPHAILGVTFEVRAIPVQAL